MLASHKDLARKLWKESTMLNSRLCLMPFARSIQEQLEREPGVATKNRKPLENLIPPWQAVMPIWELRVGQYRVFYDISFEDSIVYVRAIRRKPPGTKAEDIL
jgi:mRNA-degrading endonuclease RelE of RelBE toxin-antitoxin system